MHNIFVFNKICKSDFLEISFLYAHKNILYKYKKRVTIFEKEYMRSLFHYLCVGGSAIFKREYTKQQTANFFKYLLDCLMCDKSTDFKL